MTRRAQICLVTAGHLATCPRVVKAADALTAAGHRVRVVSARYLPWATAADIELRRGGGRRWSWTAVCYAKDASPVAWLKTGVRARSSRVAARVLGIANAPKFLVARALSRAYAELLRAAVSVPADLFYGFTAGGLPVATAAARISGVRWALDLEDLHSAEHLDHEEGRISNALARRLERAVLPGASLLTAASRPIAEAYAEIHGIELPVVVHNTFPVPLRAPSLDSADLGHFRLYWFSQTIGAGRGLEDAVRAMGRAGLTGELHLRGRPTVGYLGGLERLAQSVAPGLTIVLHAPVAPDAMVVSCHGHDVGLALEPGRPRNNALALSNKAFTYMLGGLAVALTDTPGQRPLARDLGEGALLYAPGDVEALAAGLRRWAEDRDGLRRAKAAAWEAARRRWHWEHPEERGALLEAVIKVLGR